MTRLSALVAVPKVSWAEDGKERAAKFDDQTTPTDFYSRLEKKK